MSRHVQCLSSRRPRRSFSSGHPRGPAAAIPRRELDPRRVAELNEQGPEQLHAGLQRAVPPAGGVSSYYHGR
jgi:hypothetical protein